MKLQIVALILMGLTGGIAKAQEQNASTAEKSIKDLPPISVNECTWGPESGAYLSPWGAPENEQYVCISRGPLGGRLVRLGCNDRIQLLRDMVKYTPGAYASAVTLERANKTMDSCIVEANSLDLKKLAARLTEERMGCDRIAARMPEGQDKFAQQIACYRNSLGFAVIMTKE
jgi:hypothetical protein